MNLKALAVSKPIVALAALATIGAGAGVSAIASAATSATGTTPTATTMANHARMPGVHGTISAISGTTITVVEKGFGTNATETTYTVDASAATVTKASQGSAPATVDVSSLAVGDMIDVQGTVSGTSVTATKIMSGFMGGRGFGGPGKGGMGRGVDGTVSAISGNTITVTKDDGTSYTVDASSAKVSKVVDLAVADIKVGDRIGAEGTVSGTNVVANHIMDGIPAKPAAAPAATTSN